MTNDEGRKPEGAPERSPKAGEGAPSGLDGNGPKRFSVQRKMAIVARLNIARRAPCAHQSRRRSDPLSRRRGDAGEQRAAGRDGHIDALTLKHRN
jgi:hypothetical protein